MVLSAFLLALAADPAALFQQARFAEARAAADLRTYEGQILAGSVALYENRFGEARRLLEKATRAKPGEAKPKLLLAELHYRQDRFDKAAALFRAGGREPMAAKLASFSGRKPYAVEGPAEVHIKFVRTDPLPVIEVSANGSPKANFLLDTGGGEVLLDPEFAKSLGVPVFGVTRDTFAAGQQAESQHGRLDTLQLGELTIRNLPVRVLPTRRMSAVAGGRQVDGILGTILLYHFLATIDYPNGELVLRRGGKWKPAGESLQFWLVGDHLMLAWGEVNRSKQLLFVDTGLAGSFAFTGPKSTLEQAGIPVPAQPNVEGIGGGGRVRASLFQFDRLALGTAEMTGVTGLLGPFPESLEMGQGFRIGGLISHQFFRRYAVTFDFRAMRISLQPAAQQR